MTNNKINLHNLILDWEEKKQHYDHSSNEYGVMTFAGTWKTVKDGGKRRTYIIFGLLPGSDNFRWDSCRQFNNS